MNYGGEIVSLNVYSSLYTCVLTMGINNVNAPVVSIDFLDVLIEMSMYVL